MSFRGFLVQQPLPTKRPGRGTEPRASHPTGRALDARLVGGDDLAERAVPQQRRELRRRILPPQEGRRRESRAGLRLSGGDNYDDDHVAAVGRLALGARSPPRVARRVPLIVFGYVTEHYVPQRLTGTDVLD